jgi:hypothetical protein
MKCGPPEEDDVEITGEGEVSEEVISCRRDEDFFGKQMLCLSNESSESQDSPEGGSKTEEQVDHGKVRSRREGRGYGVNSPSLSRYTEIHQSVLFSLVVWRFIMDR